MTDLFSGHALANVLAATDAKLDNTSLSAGAVDCPAKKSTTEPCLCYEIQQKSNNHIIFL